MFKSSILYQITQWRLNINTHHTKLKGDVATSFVVYDLTKKGYFISTPISENSPYDIICDTGEELLKVQVKYRNNLVIPNTTSWADKKGNHSRRIENTDFDYFAMVYGEYDKVCYPPVQLKGSTLFDDTGISWRYLTKDFEKFSKSPPERYIKLSNGRDVGEREISFECLDKALKETSTLKACYEKLNIPRSYLGKLRKKYDI